MPVYTCVAELPWDVGYKCPLGVSTFWGCTSGRVMYFVFTRMPGESYRRRLRSLLLYLCDVFRAVINSLVCWFCSSALGHVLFQICLMLCFAECIRRSFWAAAQWVAALRSAWTTPKPRWRLAGCSPSSTSNPRSTWTRRMGNTWWVRRLRVAL